MTKDEYIAQAVAEAREKAEASWKTAVRREKYREVTERVDAWADAQSEAAGVSAWVMRSHIISLARTASGVHGNQRVEGEQLQKIARAAEAFMQLYEDLRRDAKCRSPRGERGLKYR